jgi:hypothetical protein
MNLTNDEIERYRPYHTMPEFKHGYDDYVAGRVPAWDIPNVAGQAYDRGAELAMRRSMQKLRDENYVRKSQGF